MTAWVCGILRRYGQAAVLETPEGETAVQAFLQPAREPRGRALGAATEIGWVDQRLWIYLGREKIGPGDTVRWKDLAFQVRSSRPCYIGQTLSHWWAVLERRWETVE